MEFKTINIKIKVPVLPQIWQKALFICLVTVFLGVGVWTFAAFVEPSAAPADSDQDFTQNILGANNANNDFSSTNVVQNVDGSIIERLEAIASSTLFSCP